MFIQAILGWVKSLALNFGRTRTYKSALETYIVSKQPQNAGDVDRLMQEFGRKNSGGFLS